MQKNRTPAQTAKQIGTELSRTEAKGHARLACALAEPQPTHTPAPWSVDGGYIVGCADPENAETIATFDAAPSPANAKLIAAAPELLEALEFLVQDWERVHGPIPADHQAKAAIARATA